MVEYKIRKYELGLRFSGRKITSSRPAWDTKGDPVLERKREKKKKKKEKDLKKGVGNDGNWEKNWT